MLSALPPPLSPLTAISPVDGRYATKTALLRELFSEYALIRFRVRVEIEWLKYLAACGEVTGVPSLSPEAQAAADRVVEVFDQAQAQEVKRLESETNHDVKAVEHYLRNHFQNNSELNNIKELLHFAVTSEDINNLAWSLALVEARDAVVLPRLEGVSDRLAGLAEDWADTPMLARTHGQPASPTTLGKEVVNFVERLRGQMRTFSALSFRGSSAAQSVISTRTRWHTRNLTGQRSPSGL